MKRWKWIVPLAVLFPFGCADKDLSGPELSSGLSPEFVLGPPGGGSGAIFTTTPDGGIVNENVRYEGKHYVYLDGGPPPNAPAMAAGLDEGLYVFQITDPSGKVLLSRDPARCRVLEVNEAGVIERLVPPMELGASTNNWSDGVKPYSLEPCHQNPGPYPGGEPGTDFVYVPDFSGIGRHDTNSDVDPPCGAGMVVQMMPFGTTPSPGGVYGVWLSPLSAYLEASGSDLDEVPVQLAGAQDRYRCPDFCAHPDPGFVPSNADKKTDMFRVTVEYPAEITVRKFHDFDDNGVWDAGEPEIGVDQCVFGDGSIVDCTTGGGWPYEFTQPLNGGSWGDVFFTPRIHIVLPGGTYLVEESFLPGWTQTAAYLDGVPLSPLVKEVSVWVSGAVPGETHEVIFGNLRASQ